jgi:hypothetical protein
MRGSSLAIMHLAGIFSLFPLAYSSADWAMRGSSLVIMHPAGILSLFPLADSSADARSRDTKPISPGASGRILILDVAVVRALPSPVQCLVLRMKYILLQGRPSQDAPHTEVRGCTLIPGDLGTSLKARRESSGDSQTASLISVL